MKLLGFNCVMPQRNAVYLNAHWVWGNAYVVVHYCLN
jgi:hypothetical protein